MKKNNQLCRVVMLPTEKAGAIILNMALDNKLFINADKQSRCGNIQPQHLYLVSDRDIEKGDWVFDSLTKYIFQPLNTWTDTCKKIEVTTDTSLILHNNNKDNKCFGTQLSGKCFHLLPQIPQSFIEAYIKANGDIKEVSVETEWLGNLDKKWSVKTREDNTVIIHQSKTYTRAEVKALFMKKFKGMMPKHRELLENFKGTDITDAIQFGTDKAINLERLVYLRAISELDEFLDENEIYIK